MRGKQRVSRNRRQIDSIIRVDRLRGSAAHAGGLSRAGAGRHGAEDPRREVMPAAQAGSGRNSRGA
jgi:hypothetical protein